MKPTTTTPIPSPLGLDPATANQLARSLPAAAKADADALAEIAKRGTPTATEIESIASTAKPPR
jgi:hypothetical protein